MNNDVDFEGETRLRRQRAHSLPGEMWLSIASPSGLAQVPLRSSVDVIVGRSRECDVSVEDPDVSRRHASIVADEGLFVTDLGSRNGTYVGRQRLPAHQRTAISPSDVVELGSTTIIVRAGDGHSHRSCTNPFFDESLEGTCHRSARAGDVFALLRIQCPGVDPAVFEVALDGLLSPADLLTSPSPGVWQVLMQRGEPHATKLFAANLEDWARSAQVSVRIAIAHAPTDGRTPASLLASVGASSIRSMPASPLSGVPLSLLSIVERIAASPIDVLILGETGVGKERLTDAIHQLSPRRAKPLLPLNCAALSETLIESELFGYERGAFTGAHQAKPGLLESAEGGTVFLDEVGEMKMSLQVKLLRVLEERQVLRVGAVKPRPIDVRIISATNIDLEAEVEAGRFRRDLYFRLNGLSLVIPPLRERLDEIEHLARNFLHSAYRPGGAGMIDLSIEALDWLKSHSWPGNIRELRNVIERAVLLCNGDRILPEHLGRKRSVAPSAVAGIPAGLSVEAEQEARRIQEVLDQCGGNQTRAAKLLGVSRRTLLSRLDRYGLRRPRKPV